MKKAGQFVQICTTIPQEMYETAKLHQWKHSEIYKLGYMRKLDGGNDTKRINELEAENVKLASKVSRMAGRIFALEEEKEHGN